MEYLLLGKIVDKFGLDGTIKIYSTTNNAEMRYKKSAKVFLYDEKSNERKEYQVESFRKSGVFDFVKLKGFDANLADQVKGFEVQVIKDNNDLKVGFYFYSDLIGCQILDEKKNILGIVKNVEEFPAQITLRVSRKNGKDFFVPFIKQFIKNVDIQNKQIEIVVLEGMLWKSQY